MQKGNACALEEGNETQTRKDGHFAGPYTLFLYFLLIFLHKKTQISSDPSLRRQKLMFIDGTPEHAGPGQEDTTGLLVAPTQQKFGGGNGQVELFSLPHP